MFAWLWWVWLQLWPNLVASAIATGAALVVHTKRIRKILAQHHADIASAMGAAPTSEEV
jgi:hypothetical protein